MNVDMPINHRTKWTNEEFNQLLKETNNKLNIKKIAQNHKRTINAIKFRLIRYAVKLIDEEPNTSLKHIQELTNMSREDLLEGFEKIKYNYNEIEEETEDIYMSHINTLNNNLNMLRLLFYIHIIYHITHELLIIYYK
jgi:hypothetical protein